MKNHIFLSIVALIFCNTVVRADYYVYHCENNPEQTYCTKARAENVCGKNKVEEIKIKETAEEAKSRARFKKFATVLKRAG